MAACHSGEIDLHIEFQTLRRLQKSGYILFTVRTYTDPLPGVLAYPAGSFTVLPYFTMHTFWLRELLT